MTKSLYALEVNKLVKRFGETLVVDSLTLRVRQGEIFSLLGPNGAGKTTTIKILYGSLCQDAGTIDYGGTDFSRFRSEAKKRIGVCGQSDTLDYDLDVRENLEIFASYYRIPRPEAARRGEKLLLRFGLAEYGGKSPRVLSGGLKRRLQIARAMINDPEVIFLDEPTAGLDPHARRELWDILHGLRADGITILLTTHYMDEAETLADHVMIMDRGRVVEVGAPREIIARHFSGPILQVRDTDSTRRILGERGIPFDAGFGFLLSTFPGSDADTELASALADEEITRRRPNLEDVFLRITGRTF